MKISNIASVSLLSKNIFKNLEKILGNRVIVILFSCALVLLLIQGITYYQLSSTNKILKQHQKILNFYKSYLDKINIKQKFDKHPPKQKLQKFMSVYSKFKRIPKWEIKNGSIADINILKTGTTKVLDKNNTSTRKTVAISNAISTKNSPSIKTVSAAQITAQKTEPIYLQINHIPANKGMDLIRDMLEYGFNISEFQIIKTHPNKFSMTPNVVTSLYIFFNPV